MSSATGVFFFRFVVVVFLGREKEEEGKNKQNEPGDRAE